MTLFDTDFIISYFIDDQSTHDQARNMIAHLHNLNFFISNLVYQELLSVLSYKRGYKTTKEIIEKLGHFKAKVIHITEKEADEIEKIFWTFEKKKVSFIDVSNLYLARKHDYKIASFDKFYPEELLLK